MFKPITILEHPNSFILEAVIEYDRYLPRQYRNYDLYNGYKVVLNDYHRERLTPIIKKKQNIIKDTKESTKNNWTKTRKP
jgi:hypothetical protein